MPLFDPADLQAYLTDAVPVVTPQAVIVERIVASLIEAELGVDPTPSSTPRTVTLSVNAADSTVLLPRLLDSVVAVQANGVAVQYVQHGSELTVAHATFPVGTWLQHVHGDRTIDVTYLYATVPGPLRDAALLTAATMLASSTSAIGAGSSIGINREAIDDYQVGYSTAAELFGDAGLPAQALAMLRPFRRSRRSVKLRA